MSHEDIYVNDINNRFPSLTLIKSIDESITTFELLNGAIVVARASAGSAEDAVFKLRSSVVGSFDILPILTPQQRDAIGDIEVGQQIMQLSSGVIKKQFFNGQNWRTVTDT